MIMRHAGLVVPAVVVVALGGLVSSAAAAPPDAPPDLPADMETPLVVADVTDRWVLGLEVGPRTISWGGFTEAFAPLADGLAAAPEAPPYEIAARAYTPDLGKSPLELGAAVTPPVTLAFIGATTDEWSVGYDPEAVEGMGGLRVRQDGGAERVIPVGSDVAPWTGGVSVWGDTALVGPYVVNLTTEEVVNLGDVTVGEEGSDRGSCLDPWRAVLADGLLLARTGCTEAQQVLALDVPAAGLTAALLGDADAWTTVLYGSVDQMAYSRGLLVFTMPSEEVGLGYLRLDDPAAETHDLWVPGSVIALRVQGRRFVAVLEPDEFGAVAAVFEEGTDGEPVAVLDVGGLLLKAPAPAAPDGDLGALVVPGDPSAAMDLDLIPIDLYGRTLAWSTDEEIVAATLPPLVGGEVASTAPSGAKAGAAVTVTASGLQAGEEVAVWLESAPVLLGLGYAAQDGTFRASVTIPAGTVPGAHTITVQGVESGWSSADAITIAAADGGATGNPGLAVDTGR